MIALVEETRQSLLAMISDRSKDARGFRDRRDYSTLSNEELVEILDGYDAEALIAEREEEAREARAYVRWVNHVANLMEDHGIDRDTAIRWDRAAMKAEDDFGFYCYLWGFSDRRLN